MFASGVAGAMLASFLASWLFQSPVAIQETAGPRAAMAAE